jgi:hypothetical protein
MLDLLILAGVGLLAVVLVVFMLGCAIVADSWLMGRRD